MSRRRLPAPERRAVILEAARRSFSAHGYDAARTQDIARNSGVSEALMYRHFASKQALYRAVLRQTIREQNDSHDILGLQDPTPAAFVTNLKAYFTIVTSPDQDRMKEGFRLLLASLAADTRFASLVYRRARKIMRDRVTRALAAAQEAGDIVGDPLNEANMSMFIEHIGTMLNAISSMKPQMQPYASSREDIIRDAVWFCCRGAGFREEAIARYYGD